MTTVINGALGYLTTTAWSHQVPTVDNLVSFHEKSITQMLRR